MYKIDIILTAIATTAITMFLLCFFCPDLFFSFLSKIPHCFEAHVNGTSCTQVVLPNDSPIDLKVTEKIRSVKENENSNSVTFVFLMTNTSEKDIRSISGVFTIQDKKGKALSSFYFTFSHEGIPAGKSIVLKCCEITTDMSSAEGSALYNSLLSELTFSYEIDSLIYCSSEQYDTSQDEIYANA